MSRKSAVDLMALLIGQSNKWRHYAAVIAFVIDQQSCLGDWSLSRPPIKALLLSSVPEDSVLLLAVLEMPWSVHMNSIFCGWSAPPAIYFQHRDMVCTTTTTCVSHKADIM